jgi:cellobiose phosphorylase
MARVVGEHGWDGGWFRRAYDFFGRPVGSADNDEGRIYIEPQGICSMAGIGLEEGRVRRALDSGRRASRHSARDRAAPARLLELPARARRDQLLSTGLQGERGHLLPHEPVDHDRRGSWAGDGDRAFDYYLRINPSAREDLGELHRCEPYVYPQMIAGRDAPTHGEAKNSWLTGTAAWNFVAVTQWILGIRPEHDGLRVDPCLPPGWDGFRASRRFRGATYRISRAARRARAGGGRLAGEGARRGARAGGRDRRGQLRPMRSTTNTSVLARADHVAGAAPAVGEVRRDRDAPAPADLHPRHAVVPAADDLAPAEPELERVAAVPRRVELRAVC